MDPRTRLLLEAPVTPTILRLAVPNVVVMLVQASIGLIETYFIARLGLDALAGMAIVFPLVMLLTMISAGGMGGGIMSAVARALGAGHNDRANDLVWSAVLITILLGALITGLALVFGPKLYALMGGEGASLKAATTYAGIVFTGAIPLWLYNSLAAVIRATGNMFFPAAAMLAGALVLIPLSPLLIFGSGPIPPLGVAGGAVAVVAYYVIGCFVFAYYIWSGRGVLKPTVVPKRIAVDQLWDILNVGATSSVVSVSTNLIIATATGLAGLVGPAAVAGYGTGARLEYLLVPLVFGLGTPVAAMVGTAIGAGQRQRALQVAWIGATIAFASTETIGIVAAVWPTAWLHLYGADSSMVATGVEYLRIVGPAYGFFGGGLLLYFASQGAGRVGFTMLIALLRVVIAAGGGYVAVVLLRGGSVALFATLAAALVVYGLLNAVAIANGAWFKRRSEIRPTRRPPQAAPAPAPGP